MIGIGLLAGIAASALFNIGIALQAIEARDTRPKQALRLSLLVSLIRRPRWLAGLLLGGLGVPFEILAFANAPFVVVEPLLACGLLILLFMGNRLLGERVSGAVLFGVLAIIAGTALIAWGAPAHSEHHRSDLAVIAVMAAVVFASLVPFLLKGSRFDNALVPNLGSACGFAATNVATKLMADDLGSGAYPRGAIWLAVAVLAGIGATVTGMTALQRAPATTVIPISTAVQTFLPVALEPLFLTESLGTAELGGAVLLAGILVMSVGTVLIARTRAVSLLAAG
jgi:drug/metabolite transporter (DMT)-like permease